MRKVLLGLFAALLISPAMAADNAVIVTPGVGVTMKSTDVGAGVQSMQTIPSTTGGVALPSDSTNGLGVNVKACASGVCGVARTTAITNVSPIAGEVHTSAPSYTNLDSQPPTMGIDGSTWVSLHASTNGGCMPYHLAGGTAASTNSTNIKNAAGTLCGITAINTTATIGYLKVYNLSSAPTCSSATGIVHVYPIPASTSGAGIRITAAPGENYGTGIGFCVTGGGGDTDNTNTVTGIYIEASYN